MVDDIGEGPTEAVCSCESEEDEEIGLVESCNEVGVNPGLAVCRVFKISPYCRVPLSTSVLPLQLPVDGGPVAFAPFPDCSRNGRVDAPTIFSDDAMLWPNTKRVSVPISETWKIAFLNPVLGLRTVRLPFGIRPREVVERDDVKWVGHVSVVVAVVVGMCNMDRSVGVQADAEAIKLLLALGDHVRDVVAPFLSAGDVERAGLLYFRCEFTRVWICWVIPWHTGVAEIPLGIDAETFDFGHNVTLSFGCYRLCQSDTIYYLLKHQ